jgi:hypothetical protein
MYLIFFHVVGKKERKQVNNDTDLSCLPGMEYRLRDKYAVHEVGKFLVEHS